jgi:hypothetical protein
LKGYEISTISGRFQVGQAGEYDSISRQQTASFSQDNLIWYDIAGRGQPESRQDDAGN